MIPSTSHRAVTRRSTLLAALVALAMAVGVVGPPWAAEPPTDPPAGRGFAMGFTPFPWDMTLEAVRGTDEFIAKEGDLIAHHFDDGVPWTEALEDRSFHPKLEADWKRRAELGRGKRVLLSLTPLDGGRKDLALYRGEKENAPLPAAFRGKALDDPSVKKAYLSYCRRAVETFRPDYLAIGIEVNELILNSPGKWPQFLALYRETRKALKERDPKLPVFATVTLHGLADPSKKGRNGQEEKVKAFLEECDIAALSYHPFMMGNMSRPEEPLDWFRRFTAKPIAVAESSFPAETLKLETFKLTLPSTPELQAAFVEKLLDRAERDRYPFVAYFLHRDYDAMWEKIRSSAPEFFKAWKDCGLLDGEGAERPALTAWRRWLARPRKTEGE
jgi:hypothetical protein